MTNCEWTLQRNIKSGGFVGYTCQFQGCATDFRQENGKTLCCVHADPEADLSHDEDAVDSVLRKFAQKSLNDKNTSLIDFSGIRFRQNFIVSDYINLSNVEKLVLHDAAVFHANIIIDGEDSHGVHNKNLFISLDGCRADELVITTHGDLNLVITNSSFDGRVVVQCSGHLNLEIAGTEIGKSVEIEKKSLDTREKHDVATNKFSILNSMVGADVSITGFDEVSHCELEGTEISGAFCVQNFRQIGTLDLSSSGGKKILGGISLIGHQVPQFHLRPSIENLICHGRELNGPINLRNVAFNCAPAFGHTNLHPEFTEHGNVHFESKGDPQEIRRYEILSQIMKEVGNSQQSIKFSQISLDGRLKYSRARATEPGHQRNLSSLAEYIMLLVYRETSNYGASTGTPLVLIAYFFLLFSFIYFIISQLSPDSSTALQALTSVQEKTTSTLLSGTIKFSLQQAFDPFGVFVFRQLSQTSLALLIGSTIHSIVNGYLLAVFLWSLKQKLGY